MFPDQQNQNGGQPQQPYQPAPQPTYGVNSAPQQAANGQYAVVPPLPVGQNNGHSGHNPYEFIVNPDKPKVHRVPLGGSFLSRIALIIGGAVLLMIVIAVAASLLAPKSGTTGLTGIAERQQEIVRVATAAALQAKGQDTKNFVVNTELSVGSSQAQIITYLKAHGTKLGDKQLAADVNPQTDALLANAAAANTYDSAAVQSLTNQLQTYQGLLQTTYKQTSNAQVKQLLKTSFDGATLLLQQARTIH